MRMTLTIEGIPMGSQEAAIQIAVTPGSDLDVAIRDSLNRHLLAMLDAFRDKRIQQEQAAHETQRGTT